MFCVRLFTSLIMSVTTDVSGKAQPKNFFLDFSFLAEIHQTLKHSFYITFKKVKAPLDKHYISMLNTALVANAQMGPSSKIFENFQ